LDRGDAATTTAAAAAFGRTSSAGRALGESVKAALAVAVAWGWIDDATQVLAILDRLLALLWRLTHGKARAQR
jgi:hypothetical protein